MAVVPTGHPHPSGACRGDRGRAPNPCATALSPQTSVALFAGVDGQLGGFRQTETMLVTRPPMGWNTQSPADQVCQLFMALWQRPAECRSEPQTQKKLAVLQTRIAKNRPVFSRKRGGFAWYERKIDASVDLSQQVVFRHHLLRNSLFHSLLLFLSTSQRLYPSFLLVSSLFNPCGFDRR